MNTQHNMGVARTHTSADYAEETVDSYELTATRARDMHYEWRG